MVVDIVATAQVLGQTGVLLLVPVALADMVTLTHPAHVRHQPMEALQPMVAAAAAEVAVEVRSATVAAVQAAAAQEAVEATAVAREAAVQVAAAAEAAEVADKRKDGPRPSLVKS